MDELTQAAPIIRVAAHPIRLRIIDLLSKTECSVGEIAEIVGCSQPVASQHLAVMREHGILTAHRDGQRMIYRLQIKALVRLIGCIREHCQGIPG